ncbi:MAG: tRNA (adenosine(37)-N6)-dimethylallyltransferase MiaA [Candidatus Nanopelagicales bacterium]|nr:tRNA (adenosine(37)-N6)-dimethylallyltransferase MiaA [Candidatus Nanopelagicales bacterium]
MSQSTSQVLVIVGPTAVGKSSLSVKVAQALIDQGQPAEIISADSMQAYIGMDIGTASPTEEERGGIAHHLLDVWPSNHVLTVSDYQDTARAAINDVLARGVVPIVVGGSGLYVSAILDDLQFPPTDPHVRAKYEVQLEQEGPLALHRQLAKLDPKSAAVMLPTNGRRLVRALEIIELTGKPHNAKLPEPVELYSTVRVGLHIPRQEMDERIAVRVHQMIADGFVEEVKALPDLKNSVTASRALGYTQILEYLEGDCTLDEAINTTIAITKKFARRQQRWFAGDSRITWLDYNDAALVLKVCALFGADTKQ